MKYSPILGLVIAVATVTGAEASDRDKLVGSWDLVSLENRGANGQTFHPLGDDPIGRFTYTPDGKMHAQLMRGDRKPFKTADLYSGTAEEKTAAYDSYIAYYGSYTVDEAAHTLTNHVVGSLFPNWVGGDQMRFYAVKGDELVLSTKPFHAQGTEVTAHVVWHRAP